MALYHFDAELLAVPAPPTRCSEGEGLHGIASALDLTRVLSRYLTQVRRLLVMNI